MSPRRILATAILAVGAWAPAAHAGPLAEAVSGCDNLVSERPFSAWLDPFAYVLTPDGGFEAKGAGWTMSGGAGVVAGNETFQVGGSTDKRSLQLPPGSAATSPATCVGLDRPTLRFFVRRSGGGLLAALATVRVDVLYEDKAGKVHSLVTGLAPAIGGQWQPTLPMPILASLVPNLGAETAVAFRFTTVGGATWRIDDIYVDPFARH